MKIPLKISAVIITYNEEANIERCLDSLEGTADEVLVVDSFSSDRTADICKSKGVDFIQHPFDWTEDGYSVNRLTNYCGKWIRHCGWYPDTKIRLWDRSKGHWGGVNPHDHVVMDEPIRIRHLSGDLLHYSYPTIRDHISQINSFSDIAARAAFEKGRQSNLALDICLNPTLTFFKKYFLKLGLLDGYEGFVISISTAYGKFLKYIKLRELEKEQQSDVR
jgi:glycosyltransferase involved in cell wall biosynthesis